MCNALIPVYYLGGDTWLKIMPRPIEAKDPSIRKPLTKKTWKYVSPEGLESTGIYTMHDLRDLRDRIMFPVEKQSILNDIAREIHGQPLADHKGSIIELLDKKAVRKLAKTAWDAVWSDLMTFGTISAACIAIYVIFMFLKTLLDVTGRAYTLHATFGWSINLFGALSLTVYCTGQGKDNKDPIDHLKLTINV